MVAMDGAYFHTGKSLKDIEAELGGVGKQFDLTVTFSGLVEFGQTVQLLLPDGAFTYLPIESFRKAAH